MRRQAYRRIQSRATPVAVTRYSSPSGADFNAALASQELNASSPSSDFRAPLAFAQTRGAGRDDAANARLLAAMLPASPFLSARNQGAGGPSALARRHTQLYPNKRPLTPGQYCRRRNFRPYKTKSAESLKLALRPAPSTTIRDKIRPKSAKKRVDNRKVQTSQGNSVDHFFAVFFCGENVARARGGKAGETADSTQKEMSNQ
jgi:hypothetical protein